MIPLLAQIPNATPSGISSWLIDGAAILAVVLLVLNIISHFKAKPPLDEKYVSKAEHNELKGRVSTIEINHRDDLRAVFGKLDAISGSVSRIEGRLLEQDRNQ